MGLLFLLLLLLLFCVEGKAGKFTAADDDDVDLPFNCFVAWLLSTCEFNPSCASLNLLLDCLGRFFFFLFFFFLVVDLFDEVDVVVAKDTGTDEALVVEDEDDDDDDVAFVSESLLSFDAMLLSSFFFDS